MAPAGHLREACAKIRELELALGRKTTEFEILRHKRIRRVMQLHGLMLAQRVHRRHAGPPRGRDPATCLQPALVLGRLPDPLLLYAHELGLVPITTPPYSPESNGLAEAFIGTFKRDYVERSSATADFCGRVPDDA